MQKVVEPEVWNLYVEPLSNLEFFKRGTFMWNLEEPEPLCGTWNLLRVEPLCRTAFYVHLHHACH